MPVPPVPTPLYVPYPDVAFIVGIIVVLLNALDVCWRVGNALVALRDQAIVVARVRRGVAAFAREALDEGEPGKDNQSPSSPVALPPAGNPVTALPSERVSEPTPPPDFRIVAERDAEPPTLTTINREFHWVETYLSADGTALVVENHGPLPVVDLVVSSQPPIFRSLLYGSPSRYAELSRLAGRSRHEISLDLAALDRARQAANFLGRPFMCVKVTVRYYDSFVRADFEPPAFFIRIPASNHGPFIFGTYELADGNAGDWKLDRNIGDSTLPEDKEARAD